MEKTRIRQISNLVELGLEANTNPDYYIFIDISGHVDLISIRIAKHKYQNKIFMDDIYYDDHFSEKEFKSKMSIWKNKLRYIIKSIKIK